MLDDVQERYRVVTRIPVYRRTVTLVGTPALFSTPPYWTPPGVFHTALCLNGPCPDDCPASLHLAADLVGDLPDHVVVVLGESD